MHFITEATAAIRHQDAQLHSQGWRGERVLLPQPCCRASCGPAPSWAGPTRLPSWSHQAQSSPSVSQECWERVFRFDSEWTLPPLQRHQQAPPCMLDWGSAAARQSGIVQLLPLLAHPSQRSWEDTLIQACPLLSVISQCVYGAILPPNFSLERSEMFEDSKRNFGQQKKWEEISWI